MVVKAQQVRDCYHPIHEKSLPKALPMNECVKAELYFTSHSNSDLKIFSRVSKLVGAFKTRPLFPPQIEIEGRE